MIINIFLHCRPLADKSLNFHQRLPVFSIQIKIGHVWKLKLKFRHLNLQYSSHFISPKHVHWDTRDSYGAGITYWRERLSTDDLLITVFYFVAIINYICDTKMCRRKIVQGGQPYWAFSFSKGSLMGPSKLMTRGYQQIAFLNNHHRHRTTKTETKAQCCKEFYYCNLWMFIISLSDCPWQTFSN
jgi:hypothetical protein